MAEVTTVAKPDTILGWQRKGANQQVDNSEPRTSVGHPRVDKEIEDLVVRMARAHCSWGDDRMQGALNHLGYTNGLTCYVNDLRRAA